MTKFPVSTNSVRVNLGHSEKKKQVCTCPCVCIFDRLKPQEREYTPPLSVAEVVREGKQVKNKPARSLLSQPGCRGIANEMRKRINNNLNDLPHVTAG